MQPAEIIKSRKEIKMKFRDLFLPKIVRSDPEVRKEAVRNETNTDLLQKVLENDREKSVRDLAQKRLQELSA